MEKDIHELKAYLSQFSTFEVIGTIATDLVTHMKDLHAGTGLSSPEKQLLYLAGLLFSTMQKDSKPFTESKYKYVKNQIEKICLKYIFFFLPKKPESKKSLTENWKRSREVSSIVFFNYFNTSELFYLEQHIERIETWFLPFNDLIQSQFYLTIEDLIGIFKYIEIYLNNHFESIRQLYKRLEISHKDLINTIPDLNKMSIEEIKKIAEGTPYKYDYIKFVESMNLTFHISIKHFEKKFGKKKIESFLKIFTIDRKKRDFKYYTDKNPVEIKPLWRVDSNYFFCAFYKQILIAIYNFLYKTLEKSPIAQKFYTHRDNVTEKRTQDIFKLIFKNNSEHYSSIYENTKLQNEHDILIKYNNFLIIVEVKASKIREPLRDPEKAFIRIESDFKRDNGIQKAYNQGLNLKQLILSQEVTNIYGKKGNLLTEIRKEDFKQIFIIVITAENFKGVSCNLSLLLEKPENETYPWVCNIYDLETIINGFLYYNLLPEDFLFYLMERERLSEKMYCSDELEPCGYFLQYNNFSKIEESYGDQVILQPDWSDIFDKIYFESKGHSFDFDASAEPIFEDLDEFLFKDIFRNKNQKTKKVNLKIPGKKK